jgi:Domain of unknown function (DUF4279)
LKAIPKHIISSGPPGTVWFGGPVDRSKMSLRVRAKVRGESADKDAISRALGVQSDQQNLRLWSLHAPDQEDADVDAQVDWLLARVTSDLSIWARVVAEYRDDLFCGLFLERTNRGISLSPKTMAALGQRGIEMGFDIYAPEPEPNQSTDPMPLARINSTLGTYDKIKMYINYRSHAFLFTCMLC